MKGYSLEAVNDLRYKDLDYPDCPAGWSIIKVAYSGICSSDVPRICTKGTYHFPTIPGHEFSGVVDRVADEANKDMIGKKVGIFPLIPCRECEQCKQGNYEMCSNYDYVGSRRDGGFAEYVAVPTWNLVELPESVSLKEAAMMEPLSVALHAINQMSIKPGDSVGIVGTGMIAFAAGQWARKLGASNVTILGRTEDKSTIAEGIPGIDYELISECIKEFDDVLEAVGNNQAIDKAINITKAGGNLVLMGNPAGDINLSQNTYWKILRKQLHVSGTWNSSYENEEMCDWTEVRDVLANKEIEASCLITHQFDKENLREGIDLMKNHREPYCKVMISWYEE